jgi:hypothetical protein
MEYERIDRHLSTVAAETSTGHDTLALSSVSGVQMGFLPSAPAYL